MSKWFKKLREEKSEKQHDADLPTHSSDAASEVPDDEDKAAKVQKESRMKTRSQMKRESADSDLPTHSSDAASEVPDDEDKAKSTPRKADKEYDDVAIAAGAKEDGVQSSKPSNPDKSFPDREIVEAEDEEDEYDDEEEMEEKKIKYEMEDEDEEEDEEEKMSEAEDEEDDEEEDDSMEEHLSALTSGENLSEQFKAKAATIFEAAVNERVQARVKRIEKRLSKELEEGIDSLVDQLDSYLDYCVSEWVKDNEVAVEQGLRQEIAEEVIGSLRNVFSEHNINLPIEEESLLEQAKSESNTLKSELNDVIEENIELKQELQKLQRDIMINEFSADLVDAKADKFRSLVEGVTFGSMEQFSEKLKMIKESYFGSTKVTKESSLIVDGLKQPKEEKSAGGYDAIQAAYAQAISKSVRK